jgi:hypothetical protein
MRAQLITLFLCAGLGCGIAQTAAKPSGAAKSPAPAKKPATVRTECVESVGLCVSVPTAWQRLGDVFGDLGFVVAEPHPGIDSAKWPQLTVAVVDVPPKKAGASRSLDSVVDVILTPDGTFTTSQTQQRSRLLLNGNNAQIVRVLLHDAVSDSDSIEAVALIEGEESLVYSVALRCSPQDFERLEPAFQKAAHSWHIKPVAEPPATTEKTSTDPGKK